MLLTASAGFAAPVTGDTAAHAVQGWLGKDNHPLGSHLSHKIKRTEAVRNAAGETLYYVVHLNPVGYVILAGDDAADPIVAFSATGSFNASSGSAIAGLVNSDMPRRIARARAQAGTAAALKSRGKWRAFLAGSGNLPPDTAENDAVVMVSQIRVAPFVQTLWNQQFDVSEELACYNYFTPPFGAGNPGNYPCGCVATAMAQLMYYFQYPTAGVGTGIFSFTSDGTNMRARLRGGDGDGGPYQWSEMPLSPNMPDTNDAAAIGALTYDAGITINMSYTADNSAAATDVVPHALMSTFQFGNASYFENNNTGLSGTNLVNMINPNLDARLPVILGIQFNSDAVDGHCVVCDGYGYSASTLFHHLNAGWGGDNDIWYSLPYINTADDSSFNTIFSCVYNIYTNGSGQIISGRVTDPTGAPVYGATVTAGHGGSTYTATTDANGIYAVTRLPAASYTVTATNAGYSPATGVYTTANSVFTHPDSGDVWGADFVLSPPLLAVPESGFASFGPAGGPFTADAQTFTLTNASTSSISWVLNNTATWLSVSSSNGTVAAGAVSNLTVSLNSTAQTLGNGTYSGSIWITNLGNDLAQQLIFSLTLQAGDYPIAVTGFNMDVVVESNAVGGNTADYADTFDPSCSFLVTTNPPPICFYEAGLAVTNDLGSSGETSPEGLPSGGFFTNESDHVTTYQFAPYDSDNVLYLTAQAPTSSLTLNTPAAYQSLSVLAGSTQGGGDGTLIIHFADGSASTGIPFNAANYQATNHPHAGWAITNFGQLVTGFYNEYGSLDSSSYYPALYQTPIDLHSLHLDTNLITSVSFTMPGGTNAGFATGIFALSGTESAFSEIFLSGNLAFGVVATNASAQSTLTISNAGNAALTVTNISYPAGFSGAWSGTIPAGQTESVTVTFSPQVPTTYAGQITVNTDATGGIDTIPVSGFGANTGLYLTIITNGNGKVTPNLTGKPLKLKTKYMLTATPASGNVFSNWSGSTNSTKNPLTFEMEDGTVLEANFVTNPFLGPKGAYNGLFYVTNDDETTAVTEATAGMLKGLTISQKGTYSGTLIINGASHALAGTFSLAGQATNLIKRTGSQGNVLLKMVLTSGNAAPQITGTVSGTNAGAPWQATLLADRATNTVASAEYTVLIPPDTDNAPPNLSPGGDGYASITNHLGRATITGKLADGTAINQSVPVSQDGYIPVYANLYSSKGLLLGWINVDLTNATGAGLTWIRPSVARGLYAGGFTNVISSDLLLSPWTNPVAAISGLTNLVAGGQSIGITISNNYKIGATTGSTPLSGTVNPKTGAFTITLGKGSNKTVNYGIILQSPLEGGGYYLITNSSQAVNLGP